MILSLLLSSFLNTANAVPLQLTQQGRILDSSGAGVAGLHDITFRIYDSETGGTLLWSEPITVNFINGYYSAVLGADEQNNALDSDTLSQYPIWLELQLDSNAPMTNRQAINSAPYAQIAGTAESVDGGAVNASEININAMQVIDGSGNWVGQPITINWNNIDQNSIPSYIADGDDNTQLSPTQVEDYVTDGALTFAAGSEIGSDGAILGENSALDWGNIDQNSLPAGLSDGDDDTLAGLSCQSGEILGWTGSWDCVSDNTLSVSDIQNILTNNAVDLNVGTQIGGLDILTTADDSDTLAGLSCQNDGEIARYDLALDEWYCDIDQDTQLSQTQVVNHINGQDISLGAGSTINGQNILTASSTVDWSTLISVPQELADGDDDTLGDLNCSNDGEVPQYNTSTGTWSCSLVSSGGSSLSEGQVETYITNGALTFAAGSQIGTDGAILGANSSLDWSNIDTNTLPTGLADGDDNTQLSQTQVVGHVTGQDINLGSGSQVNGQNILTASSSIGWSSIDSNTLPTGLADGDDDTQLNQSQVLAHVTGQNINLGAGSQVNSQAILTESSSLDWSNINSSTIPTGLADGDDNTQLSQTEVVGHVNGQQINLGAGSQVDGNNILTSASSIGWSSINSSTLPTGLADGDDNTQLSQTEVVNHVNGQTVNLGSNSQVNGSNILTASSSIGWSSIDSNTLPTGLADGDDNTQLSQTEVVNHVAGQQINLGAGSQVNSQAILTESSSLDWSNINSSTIPTGLADGDDNTQLSQSQVLGHVSGQNINLGSSSTIDNLPIVADPGCANDGEVLLYDLASGSWICGADNDTTLSASEVQSMVQAISGLALQAGATVDGSPILTQASSIAPTQLSTSGAELNQVLVYGEDANGDVNAHWGNGCVFQQSDGAGKTVLNCGGNLVLIENSDYVWLDITLGSAHSCGIDSNYRVRCWGDNSYNQVSNVPSDSDDYFTDIASGGNHICGIDIYEAVQCWGDSASNQTTVPSQSFTTVTHLSAGMEHTCAETDNGIICWGDNNYNQTTVPSYPGTLVAGSLVSGDYHNCIATSSGVVCWGDSSNGKTSPPSGLIAITGSLVAGPSHTCAIDANDGDVECWGENSNGETTVPTLSAYATDLLLTEDTTCARLTNGSMTCWGDSLDLNYYPPTSTGDYTGFYGGGGHSCAIALQGATLDCWGDDTYNQETPPTIP